MISSIWMWGSFLAVNAGWRLCCKCSVQCTIRSYGLFLSPVCQYEFGYECTWLGLSSVCKVLYTSRLTILVQRSSTSFVFSASFGFWHCLRTTIFDCSLMLTVYAIDWHYACFCKSVGSKIFVTISAPACTTLHNRVLNVHTANLFSLSSCWYQHTTRTVLR